MTRFIIYVVVFFAFIVLLHWAVYKLAVWRRSKPQAKTLLFSMILVTTSLLFSIGVAEVGCRIWFKDITSTGDNRSYFSQRWRQSIQLNSLGFREKEFEIQKDPNNFRIAVVGDSFAYGQGILLSERFSNIIQNNFKIKNYSTEVLNFGKAGTDTIAQIEILKEHVIPTKPDFVLLQWYTNDVVVNDNSPEQRKRRYYRLIPSTTITHVLHKHSALYYLVNNFWKSTQESIGLVGNYEDWLVENLADPESDAVDLATSAINDFIEICKRESISVGIVLFPQFSESLKNDYTLDFLAKSILAQCEKHQIQCLDLKDTYSSIDDLSLLWVNQFDHHPSALANKLAAKQIIAEFGTGWSSFSN